MRPSPSIYRARPKPGFVAKEQKVVRDLNEDNKNRVELKPNGVIIICERREETREKSPEDRNSRRSFAGWKSSYQMVKLVDTESCTADVFAKEGRRVYIVA